MSMQLTVGDQFIAKLHTIEVRRMKLVASGGRGLPAANELLGEEGGWSVCWCLCMEIANLNALSRSRNGEVAHNFVVCFCNDNDCET